MGEAGEPMILVPLWVADIINWARLPQNINRMAADTHPALIAAMREFKALLADAHHRQRFAADLTPGECRAVTLTLKPKEA